MINIKNMLINSYSVYKHTFPNGKIYIGITKFKPEYRWNKGKGYDRQSYMYRAIHKYGWDNIKHEILESNLTEVDAKEKEKYYIALYQSNNKKYGYNLTIGGDGTSGVKISEERRLKFIEWNKNKVVSEETKEKLRKANLGKHHSLETKLKMSEQRKGSNNPFYGKHLTEESKNKISTANSGFNSKLSKHIGKYDLHGNLITVYGSLRQADKNGFSRRNFLNKLNEYEFVEYGGYLWKIVT